MALMPYEYAWGLVVQSKTYDPPSVIDEESSDEQALLKELKQRRSLASRIGERLKKLNPFTKKNKDAKRISDSHDQVPPTDKDENGDKDEEKQSNKLVVAVQPEHSTQTMSQLFPGRASISSFPEAQGDYPPVGNPPVKTQSLHSIIQRQTKVTVHEMLEVSSEVHGDQTTPSYTAKTAQSSYQSRCSEIKITKVPDLRKEGFWYAGSHDLLFKEVALPGKSTRLPLSTSPSTLMVSRVDENVWRSRDSTLFKHFSFHERAGSSFATDDGYRGPEFLSNKPSAVALTCKSPAVPSVTSDAQASQVSTEKCKPLSVPLVTSDAEATQVSTEINADSGLSLPVGSLGCNWMVSTQPEASRTSASRVQRSLEHDTQSAGSQFYKNSFTLSSDDHSILNSNTIPVEVDSMLDKTYQLQTSAFDCSTPLNLQTSQNQKTDLKPGSQFHKNSFTLSSDDHSILNSNTISVEMDSMLDKIYQLQTSAFDCSTPLNLQTSQSQKTDLKPVESSDKFTEQKHSKEDASYISNITYAHSTIADDSSSFTEPSSSTDQTKSAYTSGLPGQLKKNDLADRERPQYAELVYEIARILNEYEDIMAPLYFLSPSNAKLLVLGPNVGKAEQKISQLKHNYYEVVVAEREPYLLTQRNQLPIYTFPYSPGVSCSIRTKKNTVENHVAVAGGYLKDDRSIRRNLLHVATAGHAVLEPYEQQQLAENDADEVVRVRTTTIAQRVTERCQRDKYWVVPPNAAEVKTTNEAFVAYAHYIPADAAHRLKPEQRFCVDICLLQANATQLGSQLTANLAHFSSQLSSLPIPSSIFSFDEPSMDMRISGYIDINDESDIDKLREANVSLIVDGKRGGRLVQRPKTIDLNDEMFSFIPKPGVKPRTKGIIAPHIAFTIQQGTLIRGTSGSVICVYNRDEEVYYILGLLMGAFREAQIVSKQVVYQAMAYGPAIRNLKFLYGDKLPNLRPLLGRRQGVTVDYVLDSLLVNA